MKRKIILVAVCLAALGAVSLRADDNPFVGKWKLNVAKSKFTPGPGLKSANRTVVAEGSGAKYSQEGVAADGTAFTYSFSSNYDGKDSVVSGSGMPGGADAVAITRVNPHKTTAVLKKDGKEIGKASAEVSKDGKTTTITAKGKGADGKEFSSVSVFDKE